MAQNNADYARQSRRGDTKRVIEKGVTYKKFRATHKGRSK